jgi:hypothetical protein
MQLVKRRLIGGEWAVWDNRMKNFVLAQLDNIWIDPAVKIRHEGIEVQMVGIGLIGSCISWFVPDEQEAVDFVALKRDYMGDNEQMRELFGKYQKGVEDHVPQEYKDRAANRMALCDAIGIDTGVSTRICGADLLFKMACECGTELALERYDGSQG